MMLLDTVTFLWIITGSKRLSQKAAASFIDNTKDVYLSSVSVWEIIVKYNLGRLPLPEEPAIYIPKQRYIHGIETLPLEEQDVIELPNLPKIHHDPFDRMLVCQARTRDMIIVTPDKMIRDYPVKTLW